MRDTLIALVMFAAIAGGYIFLKRAGFIDPSTPHASAATRAMLKRPAKPSLVSQTDTKPVHKNSDVRGKNRDRRGFVDNLKGAKHDEKSSRHDDDQQATSFGQNEGAASDLAEAESLPSIYQEYERHDSRPAVTAASESNPKRIAKKGAGKKVVHGVPVQAYLNSKKNSLAVGDGTENSDLGMRVFVQCVELKKRGPEYVGPRNCEALLAAREGRPALGQTH